MRNFDAIVDRNSCRESRQESRFRSALRRFRHCQRGVSSVELALVLPFLALLVVAMIDYGTVINYKMQLTNAVRAGTQYAMVRKPVQQDLTGIRQAVFDTAPTDQTGTRALTTGFFCECPNGTAIQCEAECGTGERGSFVSILLTQQYPLILSYPGLDNPVSLSSEAVIRLN